MRMFESWFALHKGTSQKQSCRLVPHGLIVVAILWGVVTTLPLATAEPADPLEKKTTVTTTNWIIEDLKLELLWVKPGTFTMGSSPEEELRNKAEGPQMEVTLTHGFWLGKTEVTQFQYQSVMNTNPSAFTAVGPNAPVDGASWLDAMKYCERLTTRERSAGRLPKDYIYTLPTEAQWEYACRAGTTTPYTGDPDAMAWHDKNSGETTHPVGMKKPNPWGFHDMSGNVLEWCLDWYGDYPGGPRIDPTGPGHGYYRMARGGSWRAGVQVGRSAARSGGSPGRLDYTLGFRLALSRE